MLPGQIMLDLLGLSLSSEESELLQHPLVGGVILFSRNYDSPTQLNDLIQAIRKATTRHLLIAVDQEGGRVQRFQTGFTRLPPVSLFGKMYDEITPAKAKELAEKTGWLMAAELRVFDVDISFAPVLDIDKQISTVMAGRSFHSRPEVIVELAGAFCAGMQRAGMATVGKHFPGHGSVVADSHIALPVDERCYEEILAQDLVPFVQLSPCLNAVMTAHVIYAKADALPATFSPFWLQKVLRQQLNYQGVIFSDDLSMEGAAIMGSYPERTQAALTAGCDMILLCNNRAAVIEVLDAKLIHTSGESQQRLATLRGNKQLTQSELHKMTEWQQTVKMLQHTQ